MIAASQGPLYERLGAAPAIKIVVDVFYGKVLADERISYFFRGVDMKKQRAYQAAFLAYAMGGSMEYRGKSMTAAHQRLADEMGLCIEHFDVVKEVLAASLADVHVPQKNINEVVAMVETLRPAFQESIDIASTDERHLPTH